MSPESPTGIHASSIVIDGTCPLLRRREFVDWYIEGGVTACCPTVGSTAPAGETLRNLTAKLLAHGYSVPEVLGENWLRVMRAVWGG